MYDNFILRARASDVEENGDRPLAACETEGIEQCALHIVFDRLNAIEDRVDRPVMAEALGNTRCGNGPRLERLDECECGLVARMCFQCPCCCQANGWLRIAHER